MVLSAGSTNRCGVEQWQLVGLITRRSQVQVLPPLLRDNRRPPGSPKQASPAVFDSESLQKRRFSMNQRPIGLNVTKAITGFLQDKSAEGLSPVTVTGYDHDLKLWIEYQGEMDVAEVETTHILAYLNYLRTDYVPRRITAITTRNFLQKLFTTCISVWLRFSPGQAGSFKSIIRSKVFRAPCA
jgi:hypothetical protein